MAGELWGLWLRRLVRDADPDEPFGDLGGPIERSNARDALLVGSKGGWFGPVAAVIASCSIDGVPADKTILAGAHGGRWQQSGAVVRTAFHELSGQSDGRRGAGLGCVPKVIIVPPQPGQRSIGTVVPGWSARAGTGFGGRTSSSFRQKASFAARWPLARKP